MPYFKRANLPQFSVFLLQTLTVGFLFLSMTVVSQQYLDAYVQILTGMDKAGDTSVFAFTIKLPPIGDTIRTFFPDSVLYTESFSTEVEVC